MARDPLRPPGRGGLFGRVVRTVLIALLVAFTVGFVIGTLLRRQLEEPVRYYGHLDERHYEATRALQT
ncbi:MAG: hypothetical protein NXI30_15000 [bacterium]|nr:hypothetical protein [bacterium]